MNNRIRNGLEKAQDAADVVRELGTELWVAGKTIAYLLFRKRQLERSVFAAHEQLQPAEGTDAAIILAEMRRLEPIWERDGRARQAERERYATEDRQQGLPEDSILSTGSDFDPDDRFEVSMSEFLTRRPRTPGEPDNQVPAIRLEEGFAVPTSLLSAAMTEWLGIPPGDSPVQYAAFTHSTTRPLKDDGGPYVHELRVHIYDTIPSMGPGVSLDYQDVVLSRPDSALASTPPPAGS